MHAATIRRSTRTGASATRVAPTTSWLPLLLVVLMTTVLVSGAASGRSAADNQLGDLYSNLLQREYTGPISFPNHQVERKAQRSPSLRLRFGRRSDNSFPLFGNRFSKYIEEINKKPIRSPSLRLRFGKRDPLSSATNGDDYYSSEFAGGGDVGEQQQQQQSASLLQQRWAAAVDQLDALNEAEANSRLEQTEYDAVAPAPEKRKQVRLRFGRSYSVHDNIPHIDRPEVLTDDAVATPRLNPQLPKAGDLVSINGI